MFRPYHLIQARDWARQEGYVLVKADRVRDVSASHSISDYAIKEMHDPARYLDSLVRIRSQQIANSLRNEEALVETVGADLDSRFKVYRSNVRIIMPGTDQFPS